jgi:hypothetical protein
MNVKLTPHAVKLLEAARAQREEPIEVILEHALEALVREEHMQPVNQEAQEQAVTDMLDFLKDNRVRLGTGVSVKDFIHEGRRV